MTKKPERPAISDKPAVQALNLDLYLSDRLRAGDLDLYSAFTLAHESLRIERLSYLQPAWGHHFSLRRMLRIFMHCLTARALGLDSAEAAAERWLEHDAPLLRESRKHFLLDTSRTPNELLRDRSFLEELSTMRKRYDSLPDSAGPYPPEVFPAHYAAPERELLEPGSQAPFRCGTETLDPEVEEIVVELYSGPWG